MMKRSITINAIELATAYHSGQKRMDKIDYIIHPARVALYARTMLESISDVEIEKYFNMTRSEVEAASWLHDTIEDTSISDAEISERTSKAVLSVVRELTSDVEEIAKIGKSSYLIQKINKMSLVAFFLKLCDRYDNVSGLEFAKRKFADRYCLETEQILQGIDLPKTDNYEINNLYEDLVLMIKKELSDYRLSQTKEIKNEEFANS